MTSYETASVALAAFALLISAYSIMSAFAAKRSAQAAETQAKHAETQATAAKAQVDAAERQLFLLRSAQTFEGITRITRGRRTVISISEATAKLATTARRATNGNQIAVERDKVQALLVEIEDAMHLFPPSMWRRFGNAIELTEAAFPKLIRGGVDDEAVNSLTREWTSLSNSMQVWIGQQWAIIEPVNEQ